MNAKKVVVVGATGALGSRIAKALLDQGAEVTAMVRPGSDRKPLEDLGVKNFVTGNMMDPASLTEALGPGHRFDAVVASAAGYTRHSKGDSPKTDTLGYRNLVDASKDSGISRFILISILECDKAERVPHFYHKHLIEQYLAEKRQPYIALRAGAFLDQTPDFLPAKLAKGILPVFFYGVDYGTIYTPDLARYAAMAAVSLPDAALNSTVDVGWSAPVNGDTLAAAFEKILGKPVKARPFIPPAVVKYVAPVLAKFSSNLDDMLQMVKWVQTGDYVSRNPVKQKELFGDLPTIEEGVRRYCKDRHLA